MNQEMKFSDEHLNAFVDDQLTPEEKEQVYSCISRNEDLKQRVCKLRQVRDLVNLAYKELPQPPHRPLPVIRHKQFGRNLAAGLALAITAVASWFLYQSAGTPNATAPEMLAQRAAPAEEIAKVLIHVSDGQTAHLKTVLDEVETLMRSYRESRQRARVEVVTNSDGLNLVLAGKSPYAQRIQQMQSEYKDLTFVACQNTIDRFQRDLGVTVKLLPGVVVTDSGVAQIMRRQKQGWAYLQV